MRAFLTMVIAVTANTAFASFDLMYLPDASQTRIHRYDPVNRVYLGNFNALDSRYLAANNNSPYLVAGAGSRTYAYVAATGTYVHSASVNSTAMTMMSNGNILRLSAANAFAETSIPSFTSVVSAGTFTGTVPIATTRAIAAAGSNRLVAGLTSGGDLVLNTYSGSGTNLSSTTVAPASGLAANIGTASMAVTTSFTGTVQAWFVYRTNASIYRLMRYSISGNIATFSDSYDLGGFTTTSPNATVAVMAGHGNSVFVVGADSTNTALTRITHLAASSTITNQLSDFTTSAFSVPSTNEFNGANVIAPEPGSMVALGVGLAALLRRRRVAKN